MIKKKFKHKVFAILTAASMLASVFTGAGAAVLPSQETAESVFYAEASLDGSQIIVMFSERPNEIDVSSVDVINTEDGTGLSTDTPFLSGSAVRINVTDSMESAVEYCILLPEGMTSQSGKKLYSKEVYFISPTDAGKTQQIEVLNDTFDNYSNDGTKFNVPENWWNRQHDAKINFVEHYSDAIHDSAVKISLGGWTDSCVTRNFGKALDYKFTMEFDFNPLYFNKYIEGEEDTNLILSATQSVKDARNWPASNPFKITQLNDNMRLALAPVAETGEKRLDSKGENLKPSDFFANADVTYVSNDTLMQPTYFFQLYGDRLGFGSNVLPDEGNYVRVKQNTWYHVSIDIDCENLVATADINGEQIGPYDLPDTFKDAQYGAAAARAMFYMISTVSLPLKNHKCTYVDSKTGETKTYSHINNSYYAIDNFRVVTTAPEFKALKTRIFAADGEEFAPMQETTSIVNKMEITFTSGVDTSSINANTLAITDKEGNTYSYQVTAYDEVNYVVELTLDSILAKGREYSMSIDGVMSDLGSSVLPYASKFSVSSEPKIFLGKAMATDGYGNELTDNVSGGTTVYFDGYAANSANAAENINMFVASYKITDNGEIMTALADRSTALAAGSLIVNANTDLLSIVLPENADYVKAFIDDGDSYVKGKSKPNVSVTQNTITVKGTAAPFELMKLDIPVDSDEYIEDKSCAMIYRGVAKADKNGNYSFAISTDSVTSGAYAAYVYGNSSQTVAQNEFIYSKEADILTAAAVLNASSDKETTLGEQYVNLGINMTFYKGGSNEKAAMLLEKYGNVSETDADTAKAVLDMIYLITAIDNGNIENLFDYAYELNLSGSDLKDWLNSDYVTNAFEQTVTSALKGKAFSTTEDFYDKLTEQFVLAVVGLNDGYGDAEDIIKAFAEEIGVDQITLSDDAYRLTAGNAYTSYSALKSALVANNTTESTTGNKKNNGGGGSYTSNTKLPAVENVEANTQLLYSIFEDIEDVIWAKPAIVYLAEKGIINGTSKTTFSPNNNIKREEITKILVNAYISDAPQSQISFSDAKQGQWYYSYIAKAYGSGVVNGYDEFTFGVGEYVTRQDMAVMIYNASVAAGNVYNTSAEGESYVKFDDHDQIADYAKTAVYALRDANAINGVDGANFAPKGLATRAEAAKIIYSLLKL